MGQVTISRWDAPVVAQSWDVLFESVDHAGGAETIFVQEPVETWVTLVERSPEQTFAPQSPGENSFAVVWAPPSVSAPTAVEQSAESWLRDGRVEDNGETVRASVRTVRILWSKDRAVVFSAIAERKSALDAVVRFTLVQREIAKLDADIRAIWGPLSEDVSLTHSVRRRDQVRQSSTDARTEQAARMKLAWLRLRNSLEQLDPELSDLSKRIYAELIGAAALYDRVELSEDSIQFALDQYEVANTRLIESRIARQERVNAVTGYLFEATIIVLLAYEIFHR